MTSIRFWLGLAAVIFGAAALVHFDLLLGGYPDQSAGIAESVIGGVLILGLVVSLIRPAWTRRVAMSVLAFAILGTLVGLTLLLTVGPFTGFDLVVHLVMIVVLLIGLGVAWRGSGVGLE